MSKTPPEAYRFKPGQSGNPAGRPKSRLTAEALRAIIDRLSFMTRHEIQGVIQDPTTPMIEIEIASVIVQAAKTGDCNRINFLLERVIGKVPVTLQTEEDRKRREIAELSDDELVTRIKAKLPELEAG